MTRWREDGISDDWGTFCYLRDVASREFWSTAYQPTLQGEAENYEAIFSGRPGGVPPPGVSIGRRTPRSCVSPEDDIEVRRGPHHEPVTRRPRDRRHQLRRDGSGAGGCGRAASGVQQSVRADRDSSTATAPFFAAAPSTLAGRTGSLDVSPDGRARRGWHQRSRSRRIACASSVAAVRLVAPRAMLDPGSLSSTAGSVLDPIAAIRHQMIIDGGATVTHRHGLGRQRDARRRLAPGRQIPGSPARGSRVRAGMDAQPGGAAAAQRHRGRCAALRPPRQLGHLCQRIVAREPRRCWSGTVAGNPGLWGYAISGDLPIVLLQISAAGQHRSGAPARAGACRTGG